MLHRSFKPAKCKTALKLAIPRIKLMKNKREAQVKQLKRELAQLLESGQVQTARIRVEHVVREEKTVAAYNLLEIYCELIVARMPIIESQKNCPIDLKEAIASVIFASARCAEIPELKDVTKNFTAKYGKEFASAALELRPNCGVGRLMVEKLSVKAPDGPTKLKILTAIAEEHNVKWDPASFGAEENKVHEDLLNGPNTSTEAAQKLADPPDIQATTSHHEQRPSSVQVPNYDKGPSNVQAPKKNIERNDAPASSYEHSSRSPPYSKNFDHSNSSANNPMPSGTFPPKSSSYGTENQGREFRNKHSGDESAYSSPGQHWNMEFKDATAAAQAAAESAERASMAARAAAELSSRGNSSQQYSTASHLSSSAHGMRDEEPQKYTGSAYQSEHPARHQVDISHHRRNYRDYEQTDRRAGETEKVYGNTVRNDDKSAHGSFKSTAASFNEKSSANNQIKNAYSQRNPSEGRKMEHFAEVIVDRNSGENRMQFVNELHDSNNFPNVDHHEVRVGEKSSYSSLHSQPNTSAYDHDVISNLNRQKSENDQRESGETEMQYVNELHDTQNYESADYQEAKVRKQSSYSSSHSRSSTFSDDHDAVSNLHHQKSGSNSGDDSLLLNDEGSLQRSTKETADSYDNASAVFDDYGSDNEELNFDLKEDHKVHEYNMNFSSAGQKSPTHPFTSASSWSIAPNAESPQKSISQSQSHNFFESSTSSAVPSHGDDLPAAFDDYGPSSGSEEEEDKSKFVRRTSPDMHSPKKSVDFHQAENRISTPQLAEVMDDNEPIKDSSLEESKELNFGNLTGGLRNKGYRNPLYSKAPQHNALPSAEELGYSSTRISQSSPPTTVEASVSSGSYNQESYSRKGSVEGNRKLGTRASVSHADSSDDDSEEEQSKQPFRGTQDQSNKFPSFEENKRSGLRVPVSYFDSGNSDSDEDLPKTSPSPRLKAGFSRRTKAPPSNSRRSSNLKTTESSEPAVLSYHGGEKTFSSRNSYADEALPKTQPQKKNSDQWDSHPQTGLAAQATSKLVSETKTSSFGGTSKSSEKEQQASTSVSKIISSDTAKTQPQKKNSDQRDSHPQTGLAAPATSKLVSETKRSSFGGTSKSSEKEQKPSTSVPKVVSSDSAKSLKAQTSIGDGSSASHVHPKLPDYDTLMAHLSSLKQNRQ